jgi:hypothetical protein
LPVVLTEAATPSQGIFPAVAINAVSKKAKLFAIKKADMIGGVFARKRFGLFSFTKGW